MEGIFSTPIQELELLEGKKRIFMKREDLLGFSFGGNKVRIALELYSDLKDKGCDCMIAYGSSRSNMCRALANLGARLQIPCYVVTPEEDVVEEGAFNSAMVELFGAEIRYCSKSHVAEAVLSLMEELKGRGYRPYYMFGDQYGRGNEEAASRAYRKVYKEILTWQQEQHMTFDRIFLASGTGMTQGGLLSGQELYGGSADITGISVARFGERGKEEVARFAGTGPEKVHFEDRFVCGGYGLYDKDIEEVIKDMMEQYGIPLDPTYTGKAFAGMKKLLKEKEQEAENILFIHTGGTPLYFDYLRGSGMER